MPIAFFPGSRTISIPCPFHSSPFKKRGVERTLVAGQREGVREKRGTRGRQDTHAKITISAVYSPEERVIPFNQAGLEGREGLNFSPKRRTPGTGCARLHRPLPPHSLSLPHTPQSPALASRPTPGLFPLPGPQPASTPPSPILRRQHFRSHGRELPVATIRRYGGERMLEPRWN